VNAAFLLVTGAMLVGQGGDKKTTPVPPPAAPAVASCGHDPCGCEGWGHRLRERLGGLFNRNNCDACKPTTCCAHKPAPAPTCDTGCRTKLLNWQPHCHAPKACAPANTCTDPCGHASFNLLSKLRDRFHRNDCCDGGCGTTAAPVKSGEKIDAPKKMPDAPKKTNTEVRIESQPAPIAIQPIPTPSAVEITPVPVPVPRVEGDRRDPF